MLPVADRTDDSDRKRQAGDWLANARRDAGMTQNELELAAGLGKGNVTNYERGMAKVPDEAAERIARALGLGVIETRRGLHLWVPADVSDTTPQPADILRLLRNDPELRPDLRKHIVNQYKILRDASKAAVTPRQGDDVLRLPSVARKRTPRNKPRD